MPFFRIEREYPITGDHEDDLLKVSIERVNNGYYRLSFEGTEVPILMKKKDVFINLEKITGNKELVGIYWGGQRYNAAELDQLHHVTTTAIRVPRIVDILGLRGDKRVSLEYDEKFPRIVD